MNYNLDEIASSFALAADPVSVRPLGDGFINDTFIINTGDNSPRYILQRKNKNIFTDIPAMMNNIQMVTSFLKEKIKKEGGNSLREALTVIPAKDGKLYYCTPDNEFWAVCLFIEDTISYNSANTPELAYQGGKGIGKFQSMLSDFKEPLADILPGFHNIRFRFKQWDDALAKDAAGRKASLSTEIAWIESRRNEMLKFWELVENGTIPTRVTHNDTKINNILFGKDGDVLCVIDLDTVLGSTCLNDFGDAIRSYTNTGEEDDKDTNKVSMNIDMFRGYTQGYLSETAWFLNEYEAKYLAFSARYITYEQVLRFLMDYINGDTYYKTKYPEHNIVRTRAQYKLLQSIEEQMPKMEAIVTEEIAKIKK